MNAPYSYYNINLATSAKSPSTVHCTNTHLVGFYARYLLQKLISVFDWQGIPDYWSMDYFLYNLYLFGYVVIFNTDKFGVIPQYCTLAGLNVFYRPTNAIVSNPLIRVGTNDLVIGRNCELVRITPDYQGFIDLIGTYADAMALCMESAAVSLVNSKNAYIFKAKDKATAESFKKMYDEINAGNPAVVIDKLMSDGNSGNGWDMFNNAVGQNYITSNLLNDFRTLENMFCTAIGLPNANYNKRERMVQSEVEANRAETYATPSLWLNYLHDSLEKVNHMFNINLSVDWKFKGDEQNGNYEPARTVQL